MIYFSFKEILYSAAIAFLYGALCSLVYSISNDLFLSLKAIVLMPKKALYFSGNFSPKVMAEYCTKDFKKSLAPTSAVFKNVLDALCFSAFGASLFLVYYITLDGVFRIYPLLFSGVGFFVARKSVSNMVSVIYTHLFGYAYFLLTFSLALFFIPIRIAASLLIRLLIKLTEPIKLLYRKRRSVLLCKRKIKEIRRI